jgi:hypothetical protein
MSCERETSSVRAPPDGHKRAVHRRLNAGRARGHPATNDHNDRPSPLTPPRPRGRPPTRGQSAGPMGNTATQTPTAPRARSETWSHRTGLAPHVETATRPGRAHDQPSDPRHDPRNHGGPPRAACAHTPKVPFDARAAYPRGDPESPVAIGNLARRPRSQHAPGGPISERRGCRGRTRAKIRRSPMSTAIPLRRAERPSRVYDDSARIEGRACEQTRQSRPTSRVDDNGPLGLGVPPRMDADLARAAPEVEPSPALRG